MSSGIPHHHLSRRAPVLLAALVSCLGPAAGEETGDPLAGVPPSDPAEWHYHGIDARESSRWIQQGIIFAAWAAQWRDEGFAPEAAGAWRKITNVYTAGGFLKNGFGPEEARAWMDHGIRSGSRARAYLASGITVREAESFNAVGFDPETASEWRRAGFDARAMLAWCYGPRQSAFYHTTDCPSSRVVYKLEWAVEWRGAGFEAEAAHRANMFGIELPEAIQWKEAGFSFDETVTWRDSGFTPAEAARSRDAGLSAEEAELRRYEGSSDRGDEIASLDVEITVHADGTIDVVETLSLIDRSGGAYDSGYQMPLPRRSRLPSLRSHGFGRPTHSSPGFRLQRVEVDGAPAEHEISGGMLHVRSKRQLAGEEAQQIQIAYATDDRILAEPHHDELYFSIVEDNGAGRYVRAASATVRLPPGAQVIFADGKAGLEGRKDFVASVEETDGGDIARYTLLRPLREGMDFAVDVAFVKGAIEHGTLKRILQVDRATGGLLSSLAVFVLGLAAAFSWYLAAWHRVGRDPRGRGAAVTELSAPGGMDPALLRALGESGKVDAVSVAAELLHLAELGRIRIAEREGTYRLESTDGDVGGLPDGARELHAALFVGGKAVHLTRHRSKGFAAAARQLQARLRGEQRKRCVANRRYLWPGLIVALLTMVVALATFDAEEIDRDENGIILAVYAGFMAAAFGLLTFVFLRLLRSPTAESVMLREGIRSYVRFLRRSFAGQGLAGMVPPFLRGHLPYAMAGGLDVSDWMIRSGEAKWFRGASGNFACDDFIKAVRAAI